MAKEKEKKRDWLKVPGALAALAAIGLLLCLAGGPQGVAADSPAETQEPDTLSASGTQEPSTVPEKAELPAEEPEAAVEEPVWAGPVPEGEPVEDSYFDDAVFLGDSRTEGLQLYSGLQHGTFLCSTGATVESVFSKSVKTEMGTMPLLDALKSLDCGKIYVMLGVNELGWNGTETFRTQSTKLIERLRADHPDAEIVIQSILPVSAKKDAEGRYVNNQRIGEYNQVWQELAQELDVAYLNVAEAVTDKADCLRADWNFDGVHLNVEGCRAWLDYLRTHPVEEPEDPAEATGEPGQMTSSGQL